MWGRSVHIVAGQRRGERHAYAGLEYLSATARRRGVGGLGKLNPDIVKGYTTLSKAGQKAGHLDEKVRELIALAVAITLRCDGCNTVHTAAARERGATKEEIAEALGVAVSINAGAAVLYSTHASMHSMPPPNSTPVFEKTHNNEFRSWRWLLSKIEFNGVDESRAPSQANAFNVPTS